MVKIVTDELQPARTEVSLGRSQLPWKQRFMVGSLNWAANDAMPVVSFTFHFGRPSPVEKRESV